VRAQGQNGDGRRAVQGLRDGSANEAYLSDNRTDISRFVKIGWMLTSLQLTFQNSALILVGTLDIINSGQQRKGFESSASIDTMIDNALLPNNAPGWPSIFHFDCGVPQ
jgi:hypothetical protein